MKNRLSRRSFLKKVGVGALGATALTQQWPAEAEASATGTVFKSRWQQSLRRPWPGADYWSNPLQDWRVQEGRLECFSPGGDRNVFLLTHEVAARAGSLAMSVALGKLGNATTTEGFAGFRIGIKNPMNDYRATAVYGRGMNVGVSADGRLFVGELQPSAVRVDLSRDLRLQLHAEPSAQGYRVRLRAADLEGQHAAEMSREVPAEWVTGGVALVCSSGPVKPSPAPFSAIKDFDFYPPDQHAGGTMTFWFKDWTVGGTKIDSFPERAYGPILFTLYTVSRNILKLSAQFAPLGDGEHTALLQIRDGAGWKTIARETIDPDACNALFRVTHWSPMQDTQYRVAFDAQDGDGKTVRHTYEGTILRDPVEKQKLTVGLLTCIWDYGFPHTDFTTNLSRHKPDILLWTGDQIYEPVGGYGAIESRVDELVVPSMHDFQRKWFIFGWSTRDLLRNIPSVCMTDDHDMFHGNIWGCGGRPTNPALGTGAAAVGTVRYGDREYAIQDSGGYKMSPRWVNMAQRMQTSHLPDPFDPTPVMQNIGVYYCDLRWGGVSFAILEDRKWKSAPRPLLPEAKIVNGFAQNLSFDSAGHGDDLDAELLGQRQHSFLEAWAADWSGGTWMKLAVSQTVFGCIHTEPQGIFSDSHDPDENVPTVDTYVEGDHLVADFDSNAWPQHARDEAILKFRKAFAPHLSGDQHLGTMSHYGVEEFRDGVYGICTPAISSIWPRRWWPPQEGKNSVEGRRNTGDYLDKFGNKLTILAAACPAQYPGPGLEGLRLRATGYSILTCDKATRQITVALWPRWVDPSAAGAKPYAGWPIVMDQLDNGLWGAQWELDTIETPEFSDAVVQVQDESNGEVVYTVRIRGTRFTPKVRKPGSYTVVAFDPDGPYNHMKRGLQARRIKTA
ncbi:MAG TPA: twin-arginine translocation signal domain-containing protein [Terracidiphilus sp.]|nr:twin-arginine translocation signal domain-containing protein [Terracidiphilus sp.]